LAHLIVDGLFVASQNFHPIAIVVSLHVSKFFHVLKKSTALWGRGVETDLGKSKILKNYSLHSGQTFTQISAIARWGTSPLSNLPSQEMNGFDGYKGWPSTDSRIL
jgi:hypothetical protein